MSVVPCLRNVVSAVFIFFPYPGIFQTMGYMLATSADNTILRAHFAFMAHRNGVSVSDLANAAAGEGDTDGGEDPKKVQVPFFLILQNQRCHLVPFFVYLFGRPYIFIYLDCRLSSCLTAICVSLFRLPTAVAAYHCPFPYTLPHPIALSHPSLDCL